jgi:hypothetical protein
MYAEMYLEADDIIDMPDIIQISAVKINNGQLKKVDAMFDGATFNVSPIDESLADADA